MAKRKRQQRVKGGDKMGYSDRDRSDMVMGAAKRKRKKRVKGGESDGTTKDLFDDDGFFEFGGESDGTMEDLFHDDEGVELSVTGVDSSPDEISGKNKQQVKGGDKIGCSADDGELDNI